MKNLSGFRYPQNYLIKNPFLGFLILLLFNILIAVVIQPIQAPLPERPGFSELIIIHAFVAAITATLLSLGITRMPNFSRREDWNFGSELIAVLVILIGMETAVWLSTIILNDKLNFVYYLFIAIPFFFFTLVNINYLFHQRKYGALGGIKGKPGAKTGELIEIRSRRKKDQLSFYTSGLIYVEADGNYAKFHLSEEGKIEEKVIRNSLSNIEMQLSYFPQFLRVHRAYLVNLKKVISKHGNASGYRLRLKDIEKDIPVARDSSLIFDRVYEKFSGQTSLSFFTESDKD